MQSAEEAIKQVWTPVSKGSGRSPTSGGYKSISSGSLALWLSIPLHCLPIIYQTVACSSAGHYSLYDRVMALIIRLSCIGVWTCYVSRVLMWSENSLCHQLCFESVIHVSEINTWNVALWSTMKYFYIIPLELVFDRNSRKWRMQQEIVRVRHNHSCLSKLSSLSVSSMCMETL